MVLHLHLSPAVFDYTDWTWLGKPHTCLYKTLQLTVHVRANENHEVKGTAWRAQRQNCGKAQIWPSLQMFFTKTFGTTRTLPRAGRPAKLSYRGRRAQRSLWLSSRDAFGRWEKVVESQPSLQPSTSRGFMAEWPDGSLSSVQDTWKPAWSLLKNTWRTPRCDK